MKRFTPSKDGVEWGEEFLGYTSAVAKCPNGRFMVVQWNHHHGNWVRSNRGEGGAISRDLDVITTDNLCGGPVYMTLADAREEAGVKFE